MEVATFANARVSQTPGGNYHVQHADDSALIVSFFMKPIRQGFKSEKAGRDIYEDAEYIRIDFVGDKTKVIERPVDYEGRGGNPPDPERFPKAWQAFKNQKIEAHEGTPLEQFPPVGKSTCLNFKALNIHTVEHLAAVPDAVLHNLGTGGMDLRQKARDWLAAAKDAAVVTQLRDELAKRDADIASLREQIKELAKRKKD